MEGGRQVVGAQQEVLALQAAALGGPFVTPAAATGR